MTRSGPWDVFKLASCRIRHRHGHLQDAKSNPAVTKSLKNRKPAVPSMNWIRTCATNGVTGSEEPENEGSNSFDRPARCLRYRLGHRQGRRAAGGSTRWLQDRREIHPEIAGRRDNDRAISEQGFGRLEMAVLARWQG